MHTLILAMHSINTPSTRLGVCTQARNYSTHTYTFFSLRSRTCDLLWQCTLEYCSEICGNVAKYIASLPNSSMTAICSKPRDAMLAEWSLI